MDLVLSDRLPGMDDANVPYDLRITISPSRSTCFYPDKRMKPDREYHFGRLCFEFGKPHRRINGAI